MRRSLVNLLHCIPLQEIKLILKLFFSSSSAEHVWWLLRNVNFYFKEHFSHFFKVVQLWFKKKKNFFGLLRWLKKVAPVNVCKKNILNSCLLNSSHETGIFELLCCDLVYVWALMFELNVWVVPCWNRLKLITKKINKWGHFF